MTATIERTYDGLPEHYGQFDLQGIPGAWLPPSDFPTREISLEAIRQMLGEDLRITPADGMPIVTGDLDIFNDAPEESGITNDPSQYQPRTGRHRAPKSGWLRRSRKTQPGTIPASDLIAAYNDQSLYPIATDKTEDGEEAIPVTPFSETTEMIDETRLLRALIDLPPDDRQLRLQQLQNAVDPTADELFTLLAPLDPAISANILDKFENALQPEAASPPQIADTPEQARQTVGRHRKHSISHKRDEIADLVHLDANGRAHYTSGVNVKKDSDGNDLKNGKSLKGKFMSKHELDVLCSPAIQALIRDGLAGRDEPGTRAVVADLTSELTAEPITIQPQADDIEPRQLLTATPAAEADGRRSRLRRIGSRALAVAAVPLIVAGLVEGVTWTPNSGSTPKFPPAANFFNPAYPSPPPQLFPSSDSADRRMHTP